MLLKYEEAFQRLQFSRKQQQAFLEDLYALMKDGVPVNVAIDTIAKISESGSKYVAFSVARSLAQGQQMADGLQRWFSPAIVELIRAGENSGSLEKTMASAVKSMQQKNDALRLLINAMAYPLLVIVVACFLIVFVANSVLQNFSELRPVIDWPLAGKILMDLGHFIASAWLLLLSFLVASVFLIILFLQRSTGQLRQIVDQLPVFSLYRKLVAARFMETLGLLIGNGIVLRRALAIMKTNAEPYYAKHLMMMEYRLSDGYENVAEVFNTQLLDAADLIRLRVVSKGKKGFEQALLSLGMQAHQKSVNAIVLMGKVMGAVCLALAALIAALTIFAIYAVGSFVAT